MNDSVHIVAVEVQYVSGGIMLQSCTDTFQMSDDSSMGGAPVYLHAAKTAYERENSSLEKKIVLTSPLTTEQLD